MGHFTRVAQMDGLAEQAAAGATAAAAGGLTQAEANALLAEDPSDSLRMMSALLENPGLASTLRRLNASLRAWGLGGSGVHVPAASLPGAWVEWAGAASVQDDPDKKAQRAQVLAGFQASCTNCLVREGFRRVSSESLGYELGYEHGT